MTAIKKLIDGSGNQYFPQTHTNAVIDDNGYSVESRMQAVQDVVNQAQMETGAVPSDLTPTEDSTNWVTSGGVYNAMQVVQSELAELEGGDTTILTTVYSTGRVLFTNGGTTTLEGYNIYQIQVDSEYGTIHIPIMGGFTNDVGAILYSDNNTVIATVSYRNTTTSREWVDFGWDISSYTNASYIRFSSMPDEVYAYYYKKGKFDDYVEKSEFSEIENIVFEEIKIDASDFSSCGGRINLDTLSFITDNSYACALIDVEGYTRVSWTATTSYAFFLKDNELANSVQPNYASYDNIIGNVGDFIDVEIPSDCKYIIIYYYANRVNKAPNDFTLYRRADIDINNNTSRIYDIETKITGKDVLFSNINTEIIKPDKWKAKYLLFTNNSDYNSATYKYSDYIDCSKYSVVYLSGVANTFSSNTNVGTCFYDSNKTFISGFKHNKGDVAGMQMYSIAVPSNAAYFKTTYYLDEETYGTFMALGYLKEPYDNSNNADEILVAASNAPLWTKKKADYICTGTNDEVVIQNAIRRIAYQGGVVRLSIGNFYIDSFPNSHNDGSKVAILVPNIYAYAEVRLYGTVLPYGNGTGDYGEGRNGTKLIVRSDVYNSLDTAIQYKIICADYSELTMSSNLSWILQDFSIMLPWNQKKIMCIDNYYTNRLLLQRISLTAYNNDDLPDGAHSVALTTPPDVAVDGCIGIRSCGGSNYGVLCDYRNIVAAGFSRGFMFASEHLVAINLSGIFNVYSYTFGEYAWHNAAVHPMTFINCCDERGVNLPLFNDCGEYGSTRGSQPITFIDFNIERKAEYTPGGVLGNLAVENRKGAFRGSIDYVIQTEYGSGGNHVDEKFWEDGSGKNMKSRNQAQSLAGTSATRQTYAPNFMQQYFDTTLNKMLVCIDTATPTWVDMMGNVVV